MQWAKYVRQILSKLHFTFHDKYYCLNYCKLGKFKDITVLSRSQHFTLEKPKLSSDLSSKCSTWWKPEITQGTKHSCKTVLYMPTFSMVEANLLSSVDLEYFLQVCVWVSQSSFDSQIHCFKLSDSEHAI